MESATRPRSARTSAAVLGLTLAGALTLLLIGAETGTTGLVLGGLLAVAPVPVYVALALWLDRFEAEPHRLLLQAFAWGAAGAVFLALVLTSTITAAVTAAAGEDTGELVGTVLSAPVVEELTKSALLVLFYFRHRDEFDNVTDGIVYAAMVGLGFAMTENVQYYGHALREGAAASVETFAFRGVLAPFAHPLFTALTGIGLGVARETHRRALKWAAPAAGLAAGVGLHALWNLAAVEDAFFSVYLRVMVPVFVGVLGVAAYSLGREARVLRTHLAPLAAGGHLDPAELERMCTVRGRLLGSCAALLHGGVEEWRRYGGLHQAASELAFHRWRVARGISRGARLDAERERVYLERIRALRGGGRG